MGKGETLVLLLQQGGELKAQFKACRNAGTVGMKAEPPEAVPSTGDAVHGHGPPEHPSAHCL